MDNRTYRHSNNIEVRRIFEGRTTPDSEMRAEQINSSKSCSWCNAELPRDIAFQELHMWQAHGLKV